MYNNNSISASASSVKMNKSDKPSKSERVLVHVRIRPFTEDELIQDKTSPIEAVDLNNNSMTIKKEYDKKHFSYDTIFPINSKQNNIFDVAAKPVLDSVLDGYNGTIFAYGQTGTGKTYTMVGEFQDQSIKGIIPRSFDYIFDKIKRETNQNERYTISVAFIQIYLETIQDLLNINNQVKIREDPEKGVYLENTEWVKVTTTAQCGEAFTRGEKNRVTECTKMNAHSSRSHALLICQIEKSFCDQTSQDHVMTKAMLYLVDLAGSERVTKTKAKEMRLEEAKKINYSLLVLGNCIQSLTDPKSNHVSYRDSKLTRILQESLGGNAKTSLIVTISPSNYNAEETISSLYFGVRAMKVQNKPMINKTEDYQAQCYKLQEDYDKLMDNYSKLKIDYDVVVDECAKLKSSETYLDLQRKSLKDGFSKAIGGVGGVGGIGGTGGKGLNNQQLQQQSATLEKEIEDLKVKFAEELKTLENYYQEVIQSKAIEYEATLKEYKDNILRNENESEIIKNTNNELVSKINALTDTVTDTEQINEDLQKTVNEMLLEKTSLNEILFKLQNEKEQSEDVFKSTQNETMKLKTELTKAKAIIDEERERKRNCKYAQTQTDFIQEKTLKDTLTKLKINCNNGSSYIDVITELLKQKETIENDNNTNVLKIKKLSESIEIIRKSYDEKIEVNEKEIEQLKASNKNLNEDKAKFDNSKKELIAKNDKEINQLKAQMKEMEAATQAKNKEMKEFQEVKKSLEQKMYNIENNNKLLTMNAQAASSDYKQLQSTIGVTEKSVLKLLSQIINDINTASSYKKEIKKFESIFESDLVNTNNNNKSIEIFTTKLKNQLQKVKAMLNNTNTNANNNIESTMEVKDAIDKLSESLTESNTLSLYFINSYYKLSHTFYSQFKQTIKQKDNATTELIALENNISKKNEAYMKNSLLLIVKKNIEKFAHLCYKKNVSDLISKVNSLTNQLDKIQSDELIKNTSILFEELVIRISSIKDEKELEIENLTEKIIFLLREIDIYRKQIEPNATNNTLMSQLTLKGEEISRLNKTIEDNVTKIKALSCENSLLKSKEGGGGVSDGMRMTRNDYSEKLEEKISDYKSEISQINEKINVVKDQQITEKIDKEIKHKNDYFKERLKNNIKKK